MMATGGPPRKIVFLANDAGFLLRHFAPAVATAIRMNFTIVALVPDVSEEAKSQYSEIGFYSSPLVRDVPPLWRLINQTIWLVRMLRKERAEIVVAYSNRPALVTLLALPFTSVEKNIIYVTGLGLIDLLSSLRWRLVRMLFYGVMRAAGKSRRCHFVFENSADMVRIGLKPNGRQHIFPGAGIDPAEFVPLSLPGGEILRIAVVSRLIWSKGIDLAAQAVSELFAEGLRVELNIYGVTDEANLRPLDANDFTRLPGVNYCGYATDVRDVWRQNHVAAFPSRGGEGLPRALLEAAACARAAIVADVAGCSDFVRDGREGYVVRPNSVAALKAAIKRLIDVPDNIDTFGKAARSRVVSISTTAIIQGYYEELFRRE